MELEKNFLLNINELIGLECWGVTGGEGTGSVISIDMGKKTLRKKPSTNPYLSKLVAKYNSSHSLMVYCPWRIESKTNILSASFMPNDNNGIMVKGLKEITGTTIKNIICGSPAYDLHIEFSNETNLIVHCSNIGMDEKECYSFKSLQNWYTVNYGGEITYEKNT